MEVRPHLQRLSRPAQVVLRWTVIVLGTTLLGPGFILRDGDGPPSP